MNYLKFFKQLTGFIPYPWQQQFSNWKGEIAVVDVPTGAGKEAAATIPWLFGHKHNQDVPHRLIYCLPTRSLVDQVYNNIQELIERSGLEIQVYCLKGGKIEQGYEDNLTNPSILVGTQDQLLSRSLNRAYATDWTQWPKHAAALNNDCRWILDETQLMGVGYWTAVQLHQLRKELGTFGRAELILMSATQDLTPLKEFNLYFDYYQLMDEDHQHPYLSKKLTKAKPLERKEVSSAKDIADLACTVHQPNGLTLVVLNTVKRVEKVAKFLKNGEIPILILHSQFLGFDREQLQKILYGFKGIVIATQVVEAGVNLDANVLLTELCPWSSFVQRVGRAGRTDMEKATYIYWLDWQKDWSPLPYKKEECEETKQRLEKLTDVGLLSLAAIEISKLNLPRYLLEKKQILQFFRTHPQLRSTDYSVTEYVRDPHSFTAQVFWAEQLPETIPHQRYLCPVPVKSLNELITTQRINPKVWKEDRWQEQPSVEVGDVVCLPYAAGGYCHKLGWTGQSQDKPNYYELTAPQYYDFDPPFRHRLSLKIHSEDAVYYLKQYKSVLLKLGLEEEDIELLAQCARWHDWGKAHEIWQKYANCREEILAKSDKYGDGKQMNGYRHELASALAAAQKGAPFIAQYLIAAHHGKVRETLRELEGKFDLKVLRGVPLGSSLPKVELGDETLETVTLNYPVVLHWDKQVNELLEQLGPFRLWYLETLIRNADVEASKFRDKEAKNAITKTNFNNY